MSKDCTRILFKLGALALCVGLWATPEAQAKNGTAETLGNFLGGLIQGASSNDPPPQQQPQYAQPQYAQPQYAQPQYAQPQYAQPVLTAEALEKQKVAEQKAQLAKSAKEQESQAKLKCEMARAKADLAQGTSRAKKAQEEAVDACEDYEIAMGLAATYANEARIAALEAQVALYNPQPVVAQPSYQQPTYQPPVVEQPISQQPDPQPLPAQEPQPLPAQEPQPLPAQEPQPLPEPEHEPVAAPEAAPEPEPEPEPPVFEANLEYESTRISGFELKLTAGGFYGPFIDKGDGEHESIGPSAELLLGYHWEYLGLYASVYWQNAQKALYSQPDESNYSEQEDRLTKTTFGSLLELHVFWLNSRSFVSSFQVGVGAGRFTFLEDERYWDQEIGGYWYTHVWDEWAPVLKLGVDFDIMLSRHVYIPIDLGALTYMGTSPNMVPFSLLTFRTGVGFIF